MLKIKKTDNNNFITYKTDEFDKNGRWLYSNEYETKIDDLSITMNIL